MTFTLSYTVLVLIFSALTALLVFALLLKRKGRVRYPSVMNSNLVYSTFILAIVILLIIAPSILYNLKSYGFFSSPDCYLYLKDSNLMSQIGRIPPQSNMAEDSYYSVFPVFTLIVNTISQVLGVTSTIAMYVVNVVTQLLFWLCTWILLTRILPIKEIQPVSLVIVAFADVYLYGYLGIPIPQTLGLAILFLLLLFFTLETDSRGSAVTFLLLSILALVHVGVIPFLLAILLFAYFAQYFFHIAQFHRVHLSTVLIPFIIYASYLTFTLALGRVLAYSKEFLDFFTSFRTNLLNGSVSVNPEVSRPFAPLNALAPAFIIGTNLAFLIWCLLEQRRKHGTFGSLSIGISVAALIGIGIGSLRQRFDVMQGGGSVSRYLALPGYALGVIGTLIVLNEAIFPLILNKTQNRALRVILTLILILIVVGGLLEPLAFRPPVLPAS